MNFNLLPIFYSFVIAFFVIDCHLISQSSNYNEFNCQKPVALSLWMTCLTGSMRDVPIRSLAIPGSHDSFAYWLDDDPDLSLAPDISGWQKALLSVWSIFYGELEMRRHLRRWSLTQSMDVEEQLHQGIRYFDMRIAYDPDDNSIRFIHMLWGKKIEEEIDKIDIFLKKHPGEVVILDFNHFYEMTTNHHRVVVSYLMQKFSERIVSFHYWRRLSWLTLDRLQRSKLQVFIIYHHHSGVSMSKQVFWPDPAAISPWADTDHLPDLIPFLDKVKSHVTFFI